jgi:hypothetical protein
MPGKKVNDIGSRRLLDGTNMVPVDGEWYRVRSYQPPWVWEGMPMSIRRPWLNRKLAEGSAEVMLPIARVKAPGTMQPRRSRG